MTTLAVFCGYDPPWPCVCLQNTSNESQAAFRALASFMNSRPVPTREQWRTNRTYLVEYAVTRRKLAKHDVTAAAGASHAATHCLWFVSFAADVVI